MSPLCLFAQIEKIFGKNLPLATLFQTPTIEEMASILRDKGWSSAWASLVPIQPGGSKAPFFCIHAIGGNILMSVKEACACELHLQRITYSGGFFTTPSYFHFLYLAAVKDTVDDGNTAQDEHEGYNRLPSNSFI